MVADEGLGVVVEIGEEQGAGLTDRHWLKGLVDEFTAVPIVEEVETVAFRAFRGDADGFGGGVEVCGLNVKGLTDGIAHGWRQGIPGTYGFADGDMQVAFELFLRHKVDAGGVAREHVGLEGVKALDKVFFGAVDGQDAGLDAEAGVALDQAQACIVAVDGCQVNHTGLPEGVDT